MDAADAARAVSIGAATAALVVACSSGPSVSPPPAADPGSPVAAYVSTGPWGDGDGALLEGVVRLTDGCLVVERADGSLTVPVFPTDFAWDDAARALTGRGHAVVVDDAVSLGGGHTSEPSSIDHLPEGCGDGADLFVVHSIASPR